MGQPGLAGSFVPFWGNGRSAIDNSRNGRYMLAAADLYFLAWDCVGVGGLMKSAVMGPAKSAAVSAAKQGGKAVVQRGSRQIAETAGKGAAESLAKQAAGKATGALVPKGAKALGDWGETRLWHYLKGAGTKPGKAFGTKYGKRYLDRLVGMVAHESKAGVNVGLSRRLMRQALADRDLIRRGIINDSVWHFWQGAQPETLDFLQRCGIHFILH